MFQKCRASGCVTIVMKRYNGRDKPISAKNTNPEPTEYMCLIRASVNSNKISTVVHPKDVNKFQLAYTNLLKGNLDGLRKLKKNKSKATQ